MKDLAKTNHFDPLLEGEREELLPAKETTQDMFNDDSYADPEGAERRALNEQQERQMYPQWILEDYQVSSTDYYGNRWADGKAHLIPKQSFIDGVVACHNEGMQPEFIQGMHAMGEKDSAAQEAYELLSDCYGKMIELGNPHTYNLVIGVGNGASNQLAERAYRRYLNDQAVDNLRPEDDPNQDWVLNRGTALTQASVNASVWVRLHAEVWSQAGWGGSPQYVDWAMKSVITKKLVKTANNNDKNHRNEDAARLDAAKAKQAFKLVC